MYSKKIYNFYSFSSFNLGGLTFHMIYDGVISMKKKKQNKGKRRPMIESCLYILKEKLKV
jgi:hypothetical protein